MVIRKRNPDSSDFKQTFKWPNGKVSSSSISVLFESASQKEIERYLEKTHFPDHEICIFLHWFHGDSREVCRTEFLISSDVVPTALYLLIIDTADIKTNMESLLITRWSHCAGCAAKNIWTLVHLFTFTIDHFIIESGISDSFSNLI